MAQSNRQRRRISIYRLIEKQRSDLLDSGRHPLLKRDLSTTSAEDDDIDSVNDTPLQNIFLRVIQSSQSPHIPCYDVIIVFPKKGYAILEPLIDVFSHSLPQLTIDKKTFLKDASKTAFFISADEDCLMQTAKLIGMIDPDSIDIDDLPFQSSAQLTSQQRQTIIKHYLDSLRYFSNNYEDKAITFNLPGIKFTEGEAIIAKLSSLKLIECIFPLHSQQDLKDLRSSWVSSFFSSQPLDKIQSYFGLKIGMYFAFLGHYTFWLTAPTFLGILVFVSGFFAAQPIVDLLTILFSIFVFLWSTVYLESLKRTCRKLADKWSVKESEASSQSYTLSNSSFGIRSSFMGEVTYDETTDTLSVDFPHWKRQLIKYALSLPIISICLVMLFAIMFYILKFQTYWDQVLIEKHEYPEWTSYLPKIAFAVIVNLLDDLYYRLAVFLNNLENYAYEVTHENQLVSKLVIFQFTNSFLSLFYLAFYVGDMIKLEEQLVALLITRQVLGNLQEALWPLVHQSIVMPKKVSFKVNDHKKTDEDSEAESLEERITAAETESLLNVYESTYGDYLEMFLQFGDVVLFSSVFPLAPLFALFNNIIEIRSDAFKLCVTHQRPFAGSRVKDIGEEWFQAMNLLVYLSIIVNCALLVKSGLMQRLFPFLDETQVILAAVVVEHIMIALKIFVDKKKDLPFFGRLLLVSSPNQDDDSVMVFDE